MKKGKLIGKILGMALVLAMITGMFGALPGLRARTEASSTGIYVHDDYHTIQATVDATSLDLPPAANLAPASPNANVGTLIALGVLSTPCARQLARTSDGAWYCVYYRSDGTYTQIYGSKSTDGGETWIEEQITTAPLHHYQPSVAIDSDDNVHVAWIVFPDGDPIYQSYGYLWPGYPGYPGRVSKVQYRIKTSAWQSIEDVKTGYHTVLSMAVDSDNNVHLAIGGNNPGAWNCEGISYVKRTAAGWGPIERVSSGCWTGITAIAVDEDNNVHVVYSHAPYSESLVEMVYRQRTSSGWASEVQLQSFDNYSSGGISIAVDRNNQIHVVWGWQERQGSNYGIRYRRFTTSWQPIETLEGPTPYWQYTPAIAIDSNDHIHVIWSGQHADSPDYYQIRYREYTASWQPIENLTSSSSANQTNPNAMWASYPVVGGIKTNQPEDGYAFVWMDGTTIRYFGETAMVQSQCVETATGTGMACFTSSNGTIENLGAVPSIPPDAPAGVAFPHGMFSFEVTGLTPGEEITLTVELPDPVPAGTKWWKYHNNTWSPMNIGDDDGDNVITVTLKDGRTPDDEDAIPGQITDQGGPGYGGAVGWDTYPASKTRVLLPWILLGVGILAGGSLLLLRRRRAQS